MFPVGHCSRRCLSLLQKLSLFKGSPSKRPGIALNWGKFPISVLFSCLMKTLQLPNCPPFPSRASPALCPTAGPEVPRPGWRKLERGPGRAQRHHRGPVPPGKEGMSREGKRSIGKERDQPGREEPTCSRYPNQAEAARGDERRGRSGAERGRGSAPGNRDSTARPRDPRQDSPGPGERPPPSTATASPATVPGARGGRGSKGKSGAWTDAPEPQDDRQQTGKQNN